MRSALAIWCSSITLAMSAFTWAMGNTYTPRIASSAPLHPAFSVPAMDSPSWQFGLIEEGPMAVSFQASEPLGNLMAELSAITNKGQYNEQMKLPKPPAPKPLTP